MADASQRNIPGALGGELSSNFEDSRHLFVVQFGDGGGVICMRERAKWSHHRGMNSDRSVMLIRTCGYASGELSRKIDAKRTTFGFAMVLMHN